MSTSKAKSRYKWHRMTITVNKNKNGLKNCYRHKRKSINKSMR